MISTSQINGDLIAPNFFAPSTTCPIDHMLSEYRDKRTRIASIAQFIQKETNLVGHYTNGYRTKHNRSLYSSVEDIFNEKNAVASLNSEFWKRALDLTDVMDFMPAKRRREWNEQVVNLNTPDFEENTVNETLKTLMNQRMDFLAEMVDGIFTGLSGEHVTNRPEAFGKRMIVDWVYDQYGYGDGHKSGLIHDMRCIIAKFMGRDNPDVRSTDHLLRIFKEQTGVWFPVDGNAFRIRVYKKGTAHIEINPDIAYRLNQILAYLHPMAIPEPHRKKPKNRKKSKDFQLMENLIPFAVLNILGCSTYNTNQNSLSLAFGWKSTLDKQTIQATVDVISAIGGAHDKNKNKFSFSYDASSIINNLIVSGALPETKSHQFYPTPQSLAISVVEMANITETDQILEPSAGQGGLADLLPPQQTTCVEINPLNCEILKAKGLTCHQSDFLQWDSKRKFTRIVMNPPYSDGRATSHLEKAVSMLDNEGRLVAILPASFSGKNLFPGMDTMDAVWSDVLCNKFVGTSVNVVILTLQKQ